MRTLDAIFATLKSIVDDIIVKCSMAFSLLLLINTIDCYYCFGFFYLFTYDYYYYLKRDDKLVKFYDVGWLL